MGAGNDTAPMVAKAAMEMSSSSSTLTSTAAPPLSLLRSPVSDVWIYETTIPTVQERKQAEKADLERQSGSGGSARGRRLCGTSGVSGSRSVLPTRPNPKLILGSQLGRNASAYIDDIVIMSEREKDHIADLTETFDNMRRNGLKLNPEKCIFGIRKGQLLGCMVSKRGIQANPQKIEAL
jgi:hypothetical protein